MYAAQTHGSTLTHAHFVVLEHNVMGVAEWQTAPEVVIQLTSQEEVMAQERSATDFLVAYRRGTGGLSAACGGHCRPDSIPSPEAEEWRSE